jgi:hypothetical protein
MLKKISMGCIALCPAVALGAVLFAQQPPVNEANHEIKIMAEADAEDLTGFSEMLLKFVYEFPAKVPPPAIGCAVTPFSVDFRVT